MDTVESSARSVAPDLLRIEQRGVNVYLWTGAGGPTLIDSGLPGSAGELVDELKTQGVTPAGLQRIIITHADLDHIGGLKVIKAQSPAPVSCHAAEAPYLRGEKMKAANPSLLGYLSHPLMVFFQRRYDLGVSDIAELVVEGHVYPEGFTAIHTPGHSPGHMALLHKERGILIAGDALSNRNGKLSLPLAMATPSLGMAIESIHKLSKLSYETACFGHGPPIVGGASEAIAAFAKRSHPLT